MEIIINVKGMMCSGCENRIKNALNMVDGVERVEANHEDGTVKVVTKEIVEKELLEEKIEDLGFEIL